MANGTSYLVQFLKPFPSFRPRQIKTTDFLILGNERPSIFVGYAPVVDGLRII